MDDLARQRLRGRRIPRRRERPRGADGLVVSLSIGPDAGPAADVSEARKISAEKKTPVLAK